MIDRYPKIVVGNKQLKECLQELQRSFYVNQKRHADRLKIENFVQDFPLDYEQTKGVAFGIQSCLNYVNEFLAKLE